MLADAPLDRVYRLRVASLVDLICGFDYEVDFFRQHIAEQLRTDRGYRVLQTIPGVGPTFAAVFIAEIGDVTRFSRPGKLASWAGLTPRHHESDTTVRRGPITKQGSKLVRWAAVEAVQRLPVDLKLRADRDRIADRRGRNIAKVAAARRLLTYVYYGLVARLIEPVRLRPHSSMPPHERRDDRHPSFGPGTVQRLGPWS